MFKLPVKSASALLIFCLSVSTWGQILDDESLAEIQKRIDNGILVGVVIGVIDSTGEHYLSFGATKLHSGNKPTKNTTYDIGSISKTFTATIFMDMAKKNEISIDAPVESFLPRELSIPQIGENQITLRHLATHTSGLPLTPLNVLPVDPWDTYAEYTAEDFYQALVDTDLASKPGSQFSYSSFGMGLLAHILSINSNKGIEKLYRSRLTNPLKMTRTASQMTDRINETRAQGYSYHIETLNHVNSVWPAFKSSASDMLKYLGANLGLVKSELYPAMIAAHEIQSNQGLVHFQQAFGWWRDMADGKNIALHNGFTHGFRAFAAIDKNKKRGVVVLSNSSGYIDDIGLKILDPSVELWDSGKPLSIAMLNSINENGIDETLLEFRAIGKPELEKRYFINYDGINDLGLNYMRECKPEIGIPILQFALSLNEESADAHDSLAWAFEKNGQIDKSIHHFKKALSLNPKIPGAKEALKRLKTKKTEPVTCKSY